MQCFSYPQIIEIIFHYHTCFTQLLTNSHNDNECLNGLHCLIFCLSSCLSQMTEKEIALDICFISKIIFSLNLSDY